jgi:NADPH2:quinone reductase
MWASWYDRQGPAAEVLRYGELPNPEPALGEVRVQLSVSGINPGDTKKRAGWLNNPMAFPRIIPHSDGAGSIDAVGADIPKTLIGQRVWVYGAQSYRPFGTAAQYTTVPAPQAVPLPPNVPDEIGACLGIPGITAHYCVFADGPVRGRTVLVHGVLGGVGSLAAQLARRAGATVIGTVRHTHDLGLAEQLGLARILALDRPDAVEAVREFAPVGVERVVEVSLSDNAQFDSGVLAPHGIVAAYGTRADDTAIPFWPLLFNNATLRLFGGDDFPPEAKQLAAEDLVAAAASDDLMIPIAARYPLEQIARAHRDVESGIRGRVVLEIPAGPHPG